MNIIETGIKDLYVLEPNVFEDDRGYFFESFNLEKLPFLNDTPPFVQDNEALSNKGVLRGLHYQVGDMAQSKLVRVISGSVYDVVVDIRKDSETYGQSYGAILSGENKRQMYVPRGFAHGYVVLEDQSIFSYKCDNFYSKEHEGGIFYGDQKLNIDWQLDENSFILSEKDKVLPTLGNHRPF